MSARHWGGFPMGGAARLLVFLCTVLILLYWALCPGFLLRRCWWGQHRSSSSDSQIAQAKALYGPVLLHTTLIDVPAGFDDGCNVQAFQIWRDRETHYRMLFVSLLITIYSCVLLVRQEMRSIGFHNCGRKNLHGLMRFANRKHGAAMSLTTKRNPVFRRIEWIPPFLSACLIPFHFVTEWPGSHMLFLAGSVALVISGGIYLFSKNLKPMICSLVVIVGHVLTFPK